MIRARYGFAKAGLISQQPMFRPATCPPASRFIVSYKDGILIQTRPLFQGTRLASTSLHPPSVLLASDSFERLKTLHYRSGSGRKAKEAHFYPTSGTVPVICRLSSVFIFFTTTILSHFSSIPKLSLLLLLILPLSTRHCSLISRSLPTKSHTSKSKANSPKAPVNLTRVYRERCTLCKLKCDQRMPGARICPVLCANLRSMDIARQRLAAVPQNHVEAQV